MRLIDADAFRARMNDLRGCAIDVSDVLVELDDMPTMSGWHDAHTDPPTDSGGYLAWCSYLDGEGYNILRYNARKKEWDYWDEVDYWLKMPDPPEE